MTGDRMLETLQADVLALLRCVPSLAAVNLLAEDEGDMETKILNALGTMTGGSTSKAGCVAVVLLPTVAKAEQNLPGPPVELQARVQVIERALLNRQASGTYLRSSQVALRVLSSLHQAVLGSSLLYAAPSNPVEPVDVQKGFFSHMVTLQLRYRDLHGPGKPAAVSVSISTGETPLITLACGTAESAIYYTVDGTYPTPARGQLYSAPFSPPAVGTSIRSAAYVPDLNPGDVLEFEITN